MKILLVFLLQYILGFEMPDDANVDCYYDAFKENNLTSLMIDERALRNDVIIKKTYVTMYEFK